jgi:acetylornithine deacetylase/succinyl-diaminopimelate desuccinylase-like protein
MEPARLHRPGGEGRRRLGRDAERRRPEARGDPPRGPHAGDLLRRAGHQPGGNDAGAETICLYGHLDKQPEFNGWKNGFGPWTPRYEGGLLYGRGGADDGYAVYASITAIKSLDLQGIPRPRCVGLIETCEESGSPDLPFYVEALGERLGHIALVVCLDSGAGNYDQLWLTTSLRGNVTGTLKVEILTEGIHSGDASGLVPSSFRILRQVLDRLEDSKTGRLCPRACTARFPADRIEQAKATAADPRRRGLEALPLGLRRRRRPDPADHDRSGRGAAQPHLAADALGHRRRRHAGAQGRGQRAAPLHRVQAQPAHAAAGRRRRGGAGAEGPARGQRALQRQGHLPCRWPHGCRRRDRLERAQPRALAGAALDSASQAHFGAPCGYIGQGGTIPLMNMLQQSFPKAQMMVCGVLGPKSNAHGPNEFLHVPYGKKLTAAVAQVMAACP